MLPVPDSRLPGITDKARFTSSGLVWCWLWCSCNSDGVGLPATGDTSSSSTADASAGSEPDLMGDDFPAPPSIDDGPFCRGAARPDCANAPFFPVPNCVAPTCEDCTRLAELEILRTFDDAAVVITVSDRSTLSRRREGGPIERHDADGSLLWSFADEPFDDAGVGLAPWGDALVASQVIDGRPRPKLMALDGAGTVRWTTVLEDEASFDRVVTDGTRVLAAGAAEQLNTPEDRGFVACFTPEGELLWSRKLVDMSRINAVTFAGEDVVVHGDGIVPTAWRRLTRLDGDGTTLWSLEVGLPEFGVVEALVDAGAGRTWVFGRRDDMPWGVMIEADGAASRALECAFPTVPDPDYYMPYGAARAAVVGDDGVVAVGVGTVGTHESPWIAWLVDGSPVAARLLKGSSASVRQLIWDDQDELLAVVGFYDGDREPSNWVEVLVVRQ